MRNIPYTSCGTTNRCLQLIALSNTPYYLGVTLERPLAYRHHFDKVGGKLSTRYNLLSKLTLPYIMGCLPTYITYVGTCTLLVGCRIRCSSIGRISTCQMSITSVEQYLPYGHRVPKTHPSKPALFTQRYSSTSHQTSYSKWGRTTQSVAW